MPAMSTTRTARALGAELPDPVRTRVVALAADVLPAGRRAARAAAQGGGFAPAAPRPAGRHRDRRRARGRRRLPRAGRPPRSRAARRTLAAALADGRGPAAADPVERRGAGLADAPRGLGGGLSTTPCAGWPRPRRRARRRRSSTAADRRRDAEQALRDLRAAHRAQLEELKAENTTLRRKLGEARAAERAAGPTAEEATSRRARRPGAGRGRARRRPGRGAAPAARPGRASSRPRRSRPRAATAHRPGRGDAPRPAAPRHLIDAAPGLRRELALPAATGTPGTGSRRRSPRRPARPVAGAAAPRPGEPGAAGAATWRCRGRG